MDEPVDIRRVRFPIPEIVEARIRRRSPASVVRSRRQDLRHPHDIAVRKLRRRLAALEYATIAEAATILKVDQKEIRKRIRAGELAAHGTPFGQLIPRCDIDPGAATALEPYKPALEEYRRALMRSTDLEPKAPVYE